MVSSYYYDAVMLDNPMAMYKLDESNQGNNQVAYDTSKDAASALNATYKGTPPTTGALPLVSGGVYGTVLGSSNYIEIPSMEMWNLSRESYAFTVEMWFLLNDKNQTGIRLFQPYTSTGAVENNYIGIEDGQVIFKVSNTENAKSTGQDTVIFHDLLEPQMSHHLVATFDNGRIELYIDQKLVAAAKVPYKQKWNFVTSNYRVAGPSSGSVTVDAISLYKTILSAEAIQRHYLLGRSTVGSQEIAKRTQGHFFPIDDTDSDAVVDIDFPQDGVWPVSDSSYNVSYNRNEIGLVDVTSPDTVDDNIFFTGGSFQLLPGEKLISDDMSTFNNGINLFENASFDVDVAVAPAGVPDLWDVVNTAGGGSSVTMSQDAMSSQYSAVLTLGATANGNKIAIKNTNKIPVKETVVNDAGNPYGIIPLKLPTPEPFDPTGGNPNKMVLSFDVKGTLSAQVFQARVLQWNGGSALADTVIPINVPTSWVSRVISFDILSNATDVVVQFEAVSNGTATGQVFIDNAMLQLGYMFNDYVDGWFKHSSHALPRLSRGELYDSGFYSLKLECTDASSTEIGIKSERLPADPDDVIYARFSSYLVADLAGTETSEIRYEWYDVSGTKIGATVTSSQSIGVGAWTPMYAANKAPALTSSVQITFVLKSTSALQLGREVYFDNIYIQDLVGEAAQYLVVEEMNRVASASEGAAGVGFYLANFHQETSREFCIMSLDDESNGMQIVKKYDTADSKHKIVLRHAYVDNGLPAKYDITLKELAGGDYNAWHYVLLAWSGDLFSAALDAGTWIVTEYDTSSHSSFQLSYSTELTLGAGIDGQNGLGTAIKNVKIHEYIPSTASFVSDQTSNGNYYLPLANDVNICMKGYAEFTFDFNGVYESIDDAKIEWGPNNNAVKLYGGVVTNPPTQLTSGGEPSPIKGGYCPSLTAPQYYLRAAFETTNLIYRPATLQYMSLTMLDNVKFKTKTANHVLKPTGSFTVPTKSTPIINQFAQNGIKFTKGSASKNFVPNGGFTYDTSNWVPWRDAWCILERSTEEYVSGGSSLKVTALKDRAEFATIANGSRNWFKHFVTDFGDNAFDYTSNCTATQTSDIKRDSGLPVAKITKTAAGSNHTFGLTRTNGKRYAMAWTGVQYRVTLKIYKTVARPLTVYIDEYNSSNTIVGTTSAVLNTATVGEWETVSLTNPANVAGVTLSLYVTGNNSDGWLANETYYIADVQFEYSNPLPSPYAYDPYGFTDGPPISIAGLSPSTQYTLSAKVKSNIGNSCSAFIRILWVDAAGATISPYDTNSVISVDSGWTTISATITSPANTSSAWLRFFITNISSGEVLYVDEVQLEQGASVTAYEDNVPSVMRLELDKKYLTSASNDEGYMSSMPRQQNIGTFEQWIRYDDANPAPGTTLTVAEHRTSFSTKCGIYYTSTGITYTNMQAVYLDGVAISSGTTNFVRGKWHHLVFIPNNFSTTINHIVNPVPQGTTAWNASASTTMSSESIEHPVGSTALTATWTGGAAATGYQCSLYTDVTQLGQLKYYTLSFYARASTTSRQPIAYIQWKNSAGTELRNSRITFEQQAVSTKWTRYYATFYTPSSTDKATVFIGFVGAANTEKFYVAGIMLVNDGYNTAYFDGSVYPGVWEGTANNSRSLIYNYFGNYNECIDQSINSKWFWNGSYNGAGQMTATYSNITIHEKALTASQVLDNYQSTLSRGTSIAVDDVMETVIGGSYPKIYDGAPLSISAPWQVFNGTP
jgi:hypothetical protein